MIDVLAPPSCFVGGMDPRVVHWLRDLIVGVDWWYVIQWAALIVLSLAVYTVIAVKAWNWFLNYFDHRTPYEKWLDRKEEDEEQAEYLKKYQKEQAEKHRKKEK